MSKFTDAAETLKKAAAKYEAMNAAAQVLAEIGSLEQSAEEAKAAATRAVTEKESAYAELVKVKEELKRTKEKAVEIASEANAQAMEKLRDADQRAEAIIASAVEDAAKRLAEANKAAETATAPVSARIAELVAERAALTAELGQTQKVLSAKREELEALEGKINEARAAIAKMLG